MRQLGGNCDGAVPARELARVPAKLACMPWKRLVSAALLRPLSPPGKPPPVSWKFDVFLTHDWGTDELGRPNHDRVKRANAWLKQRGIVAWFDEEMMEGAQCCVVRAPFPWRINKRAHDSN